MKRLFLILPLCLSHAVQGLRAQELSGVYTPATSTCPTPEEARKKMSVPPGYEVRCFAHEPMVQNPVAMTWDHRGRLWVVELYEYPEGSKLPTPFGGEAEDDQYHPMPRLEKEHPRDRVVILEDADNDGVADTRTVFVEGLNLASGIILGDGGVYVGQEPHLLHFRDNNGDDRPDEWRVCLTGFGREDTHELLNSFSWSPDGWLNMTHGVFTFSKVRRPGQPPSEGFTFNAGLGRCRPLPQERELCRTSGRAPAFEFEVYADGTSNPWGADHDARGNYFVSACVIDHLFHLAPGGLYIRQGGAPENPYSYELLPSIVNYKHFRAAYAGVQCYQGGVYPPDTDGDLFIGNIHDNAIHQEAIAPAGASFKASPVRDFLRANDGWFRPVSTQTGPDGVLWVMDWCDKYPCYQNAKANPEGVDRDRGRIWRVVHTGARPGTPVTSRPRKDLDLSKESTPALVALLDHPNNWMRRMARRLLAERAPEAGLGDTLVAAYGQAARQETRRELFWTLNQVDRSASTTLLEAVLSNDPAIRQWAALFAGANELTGTRILEMLASDPDDGVRLAVAAACRDWLFLRPTANRERPPLRAGSVRPTVEATAQVTMPVLGRLVASSSQTGTGTLPLAIWMALEPQLAARPALWLDWLARVAPGSEPLSGALVKKALRRVGDTRSASNVDLAVAFCDRMQGHPLLLAGALEGLVKAQDSGVIKPSRSAEASLLAWRSSPSPEVRRQALHLAVLWGDASAVTEMMAQVLDAKMPLQDRVNALQVSRRAGPAAIQGSLQKLLAANLPEPLLLEAVRAAAEAGADDLPALLVKRWAGAGASLRSAIAESLTARPAWAALLLDAVQSGAIPRTEVPMTVSRFFATQKDEGLKKRAADLLGAWRESNADVKALIAAKRKAALEGEPDLAAGRVLFQASCAVCHAFHGGGQKVGPELIGSGRSNLDALLANVIDPNQIIGNGYEAFNVITRDNRTLSGRVVEESPGHVKLLAAGGAEQVVPRDQIAKIENTHQSMMPMGFGALPDAMFRDLIWYVLAPPEEGPLTAEKKKALSTSIDAPAVRPKSPWHKPDWESVSLWNPAWKVSAPEFERTPVKLSEFHGRKNVLLMHPFDEGRPSVLERTVKLEGGKPHRLTVTVAAHDQGDWELRVRVNGKLVKTEKIGHEGERWKVVSVDLSAQAGQEVKIQLEGAATGWSWEFGYWGEITLE